MKISCKWLMDMDEAEIENLIRPPIGTEPNVGFISAVNLANRGFLNIKQARLFLKYVVSGLCRKIFERAIPLYKVGEKRSAFRPRELVEWLRIIVNEIKNKLFDYCKNQ